jgi:UDP-2,3-diacylglucosamine pyrophosphatase LpxH
MTTSCDTLLLSDLHLGSEVSRAADALALLQSTNFRQLILLGDIFSDLNFNRLTGDHWRFLSEIRRLSNPRHRKKIIWVEGNHDVGLSNLMSHLTGIPVYERYVWEYQGLRHVAVHGHQFDRFVSKNYLLSRMGVRIYEEFQRFDTKNKTITNAVDRLSTRWLRLSDKVAEGALNYAAAGHAHRIFCGHTHAPITRSHNGIDYFNTGCWVDQLPTYITVDEQGVRLREFHTRTRHRHPREERRELPATALGLFEQAGLPPVHPYESIRC